MRLHLARLSAILALGIMPATAHAASLEVQNAESTVYFDTGFMHQQYHENISPGDDESGSTPGFGIGFSVLRSTNPRNLGAIDLYALLDYHLNGGNINYSGHTQIFNGYNFDYAPLSATDHAIFQNVEARIGAGFPLVGGGESIPFLSLGYQSWSRDVTSDEVGPSSELYHEGAFGGGWKFDLPVGKTLVASATGQILALAGGGISAGSSTLGTFGVSPEEKLELGLDDAITPRWHVFAKANLTHYTYPGTSPQFYYADGYEFYEYEPTSTTTQFGLNVGVGYSF